MKKRLMNSTFEGIMAGKLRALVFLLFTPLHALFGQGSAGMNATIEPRTLVDIPTAGMLSHRNLAVDLDFFQAGGVLAGFSVGIVDRVLIGVAYGGTSLLGTDKPSWNQRPGFNVKLRLLDESSIAPAIALGFDSQGKEAYIDSLNRYTIKPLGFYAAGSKNYQMLGFLSVHGGLNYSLDQSDANTNPNFFCGIEKSVGPFATAVAEYNFNLNDDLRSNHGNDRGYLNLGLRVSIGGGYTIGLNFKDASKSLSSFSVGNRTIQIEYVRPF